LKGSILH